MHASVPDCAFCEIAQRGESDAREVYRDEHVVAFFPTEPAVLGHTLLIPRKHVPDIWSLTDDSAHHLATGALLLARGLREALRPAGLNVIQSNGEAATQTVLHLHIHLVPRWMGDAMGRIWPEETNYSEGRKDDVLARIQAALHQGEASRG